MGTAQNHEIRLRRRPQGLVSADDFELATTAIPQPGEGQALVRNVYFSVDPYMRGRMNAAKSYAAPDEVGKTMGAAAVAEVPVRVLGTVGGETVALAFALLPTGWELPAGHRIGLSIAGADRDNFALWPYGRPGRWRLELGGEAPAQLELPVL